MFSSISDPVFRLRIIAIIEGFSFLALLFITMPLKYYMDMPLPNKYVGYGHGILFIVYIFLALETVIRRRISALQFLRVVVASIIPFGTFFNETMLKEQEQKTTIA